MGRVEQVFPSFIYQGELTPSVSRKLNRELTREMSTLERIDNHGRDWSRDHYVGGYSSYSSMANLHQMSPHFAELAALLEPHAKRFARALKWESRFLKQLSMTTCWANSMGKGTHHTLHIHPHSVISGVYYVNAPTRSSALKIEDPRMGYFMASPPRRSSAPWREQPYIHLAPKPGKFVLFESWMRHEVPPHGGNERRLSVSFNYEV